VKRIFNKFAYFVSNKSNVGYIAIIILFIIYSAIFYFAAIKKYQELYIDQKYREQAIAAESGSNSIHIFLELAKNSLLLLSRNPSVINEDAQIQENLNKYVSDWGKTPVIAVARFDKDGIVRYYATSTEGIDPSLIENYSIEGTEFFDWAETAKEGDIYLGKPMMPKLKIPNLQFVLPISTPVYKNGEFDGILGIGIALPKLASTFLDPMHVSVNSRAYLIHSDSTVIASISGDEGLVGLNYFKMLQDKPYPDSDKVEAALANALKDNNSGRLDVVLFSPPKKAYVRFLIAYSPVIFDNQHWTIGLAVPFDDINSGLVPFKQGGIVFFSLFIVIILTMSFIGTLFNKLITRIRNVPPIQ
jgi:hypothetical protein